MNEIASYRDPTEDPRLAQIISALVSPRHGVIRFLYEMANPPSCPPLHICIASMAPPHHFRDGLINNQYLNHVYSAAGAGQTREAGLWSALGEAIERYTASIYFDDDLLTSSARDLGPECVPIEKFVLFDEEQYVPGFRFARFDPDFKRRWAHCSNLITGERKWIPAQMIWLGFTGSDPKENLQQTLSSGLATGQTLDNALFGGLREVIERDTFASHWLLRNPGRRISLSEQQIASFPSGFGVYLNNPHATTLLRVMDNEFGVPVVIAIVRERQTRKIALGAACHPKLSSAIYKAVIEAMHTRQWAERLEASAAQFPTRDTVQEFADHVLFYRNPENYPYVEYLFGGESEPVDLEQPEAIDSREATISIARKLSEHGYDTYWCDLTTSDIASVGLSVVKVIVPGLQPMYCGTAIPMDRKRINVVAKWMGCAAHTLNTEPHPFP